MSDATAARLAALIHTVTDGDLDAERVRRSKEPLGALGLTSLATLRLVDAVEEEFDVVLDLERMHLCDFEGLIEQVTGRPAGQSR